MSSGQCLGYRALLTGIQRRAYIKFGVCVCGSHPPSDDSVKRQFYAGNKEITPVILGQITRVVWDACH